MLSPFINQNRDLILNLAKQFGAKNVRVFGSMVRGEAEPQSDIDLLVEMEKGRDYLDVVGFWQELEEKLGRKVDLLTDGGVSPYLKDTIYREAQPL